MFRVRPVNIEMEVFKSSFIPIQSSLLCLPTINYILLLFPQVLILLLGRGNFWNAAD